MKSKNNTVATETDPTISTKSILHNTSVPASTTIQYKQQRDSSNESCPTWQQNTDSQQMQYSKKFWRNTRTV